MLRVPAGFLPRWRDVPHVAALLARAYRPARCGWIWPLTLPIWLTEASTRRASQTLLAHGASTVTVNLPLRLSGRCRQALAALVGVVGTVAAFSVLGGLCGALTRHREGSLIGALAGTVTLLMLAVPQLLASASTVRRNLRLQAVLKRLRRSGGAWCEVSSLAGEDPVAAHRMLQALLHWADQHQIGLLALPRSQQLRTTFARAGFREADGQRDVLVRPAGVLSGGIRRRTVVR